MNQQTYSTSFGTCYSEDGKEYIQASFWYFIIFAQFRLLVKHSPHQFSQHIYHNILVMVYVLTTVTYHQETLVEKGPLVPVRNGHLSRMRNQD